MLLRNERKIQKGKGKNIFWILAERFIASITNLRSKILSPSTLNLLREFATHRKFRSTLVGWIFNSECSLIMLASLTRKPISIRLILLPHKKGKLFCKYKNMRSIPYIQETQKPTRKVFSFSILSHFVSI